MNTSYKFAVKKIEIVFNNYKNETNKYIALYRAIKDCITKSDIPDNWLLPSTRVLSKELELSRTTVNKSYELLQLEKLIISKAGSGYRVKSGTDKKNENPLNQTTTHNCYPNISEKGKAYRKNIDLINKDKKSHLAFRPGLPPIDIFPVNQWKKLLNIYWRHIKSSNLSYTSSTGLVELKKSISNYLNISRNIKCNHNQIVIVSGSLQSLYLTATTLIDKGDSVVLENPVFPNVHSVFKSSQANLIPVELDHEGIDLKSIDKDVLMPKVIHVTPTNHYPLGIKMSLDRRKEVLSWASKKGAIVIENDYENEIANSEISIPSIFSLDNEDRTIYMGTFNRLLHPSIRLGYMILPNYLIETIEALQEVSHKFVSPSIQVVMNQFIEKNYLYQHIKNSISIANKRYETFCNTFNSISSKMYIDKGPCSSYHVVARFLKTGNEKLEKTILTQLKDKNITAHALSKCYIDAPKNFGIILGYSAIRSSLMVKKLNQIKDYV
jgi:GntR family transcriptional regulator/MocR family aminotransferase